jgi:peptide-methionine (R)-S-oxide reductase
MEPKQQNPNLTNEQKAVLFNKADEVPFSGRLLHNEEKGAYVCVNCGQVLFDSDTKFESHSGWPSFYDVARSNAVKLGQGDSNGMYGIEVTCANCGAYLGHLFSDGYDQPTGQRYCINSLSLDFKKAGQKENTK